MDTYDSSVHSYTKNQNFKTPPIKLYAVPDSGVDGRGQNLHYIENSFKDKIIQIHLYFFCNTFSFLKYKKVFFLDQYLLHLKQIFLYLSLRPIVVKHNFPLVLHMLLINFSHIISHSTEVNVECVEKVKILNAYYEVSIAIWSNA